MHVRGADRHEGHRRLAAEHREQIEQLRIQAEIGQRVCRKFAEPAEQTARHFDFLDVPLLERDAARDVHELRDLDRRLRDARADQLALEVEVDRLGRRPGRYRVSGRSDRIGLRGEAFHKIDRPVAEQRARAGNDRPAEIELDIDVIRRQCEDARAAIDEAGAVRSELKRREGGKRLAYHWLEDSERHVEVLDEKADRSLIGKPFGEVRSIKIDVLVRRETDERRRVADADRRHVHVDVLDRGKGVANVDIEQALQAREDRSDLDFDLLDELVELRRDPVDLGLESGPDLGLDLRLGVGEPLVDDRRDRTGDAVDASRERLAQRVLDRARDLLLDRLQEQLHQAVERCRDGGEDLVDQIADRRFHARRKLRGETLDLFGQRARDIADGTLDRALQLVKDLSNERLDLAEDLSLDRSDGGLNPDLDFVLQILQLRRQDLETRVEVLDHARCKLTKIVRDAGPDRHGLAAAHVDREIAVQVDELRYVHQNVVGGGVDLALRLVQIDGTLTRLDFIPDRVGRVVLPVAVRIGGLDSLQVGARLQRCSHVLEGGFE